MELPGSLLATDVHVNASYGSMADLFTGKVNLAELEEMVSDMLRTGNYDLNNSGYEKSKHSVGVRCPECKTGILIHSEGCQKCSSCPFSKCWVYKIIKYDRLLNE